MARGKSWFRTIIARLTGKADAPRGRRDGAVSGEARPGVDPGPAEQPGPRQGSRPEPRPAARKAPSPARTPLIVRLGIDFGTSFTKVVWRDQGLTTERYGVVPILQDEPYAASLVYRTQKGDLKVGPARGAVGVPRLKMRLAAPWAGDDPVEIEAMAIFYLGSVLRSAIARMEADFPTNVVDVEGAAVGYPAEWVDYELLRNRFQQVAALAWLWAKDAAAPTALRKFEAWRAKQDAAAIRIAAELFEVRREVEAAVDSFVMRRDAGEGKYLFVDVGGGTLDAACFRLTRTDARCIFLFDARVESLGLEELVDRALERHPKSNRERLAEEIAGVIRRSRDWDWALQAVRTFVAGVILRAKGDEDWLVDPPQSRPVITMPDRVNATAPLRLFLGGGGARCTLYREAIEAMWSAHKLGNCGVPRLEVHHLGPPEGEVQWPKNAEFDRFAVAFGLSRSPFDVVEWRLSPQSTQRTDEGHRRARPEIVDYADSKDRYDR